MATYKKSIGMWGTHDLAGGDPRKLLDLARQADAAGIDQLNFTDHVIMSENTGVYPFGDFPVAPQYPWFEPMVLMSMIAGCTSRVRVATGVLIAPLRPAALLAKMAATLDVLSGGRLDLGVGTGWQREEYDACGLPFEGRLARLDDQVRAMRALWSGSPVTFHSETVNIEQLYSLPLPVQEGGVPLWFGISPTEENARRIAEFGDGWVPIKGSRKFIREGSSLIRAAFEAAGRDPSTLCVRAVAPPALNAQGEPDLDRVEEVVEPLVEAGATHIEFLPYMYVRAPEDFPPFFERIAAL